VGIAELKARLSHYLRAVQQGRQLTVLDRDRPIARIVPHSGNPVQLSVREPVGAARPSDVELPPPIEIDVDVVDVLLEERGER
jgi:prevent-host-death family protein